MKELYVTTREIEILGSHLERAGRIIESKLAEERGGIQTDMSVSFLPASLTREGSAMIAAMGTRNPFRYPDIAAKTGRLPADFHGATTIVPPEEIQKAGGKLGRIAHTSIMEQTIVGPSADGGDRALSVEGISAAVLLDIVGRMRYGALEIFSSRAGILTNFEIPRALDSYPSDKEIYLEAVQQTMKIYRFATQLAAAHFLSTIKKGEKERQFEYEQRILSLALDLSRNVTPMACTMHGTFTFANALAAQEELTRMWSAYPRLDETKEFCENVLAAISPGTPTLLKYTGPRDGMTKAQKYQREISQEMVFAESEVQFLPAELQGSGVDYFLFSGDNIDRLTAAIIQRFSNQNFGTIINGVRNLPIGEKNRIIEKFLSSFNPYDLPPEELGVIQGEFGYRFTVGAMMEYVRHRPPKKIGVMHTKDLGYLIHPFWRETFGQEVEDLLKGSFDSCYLAWDHFRKIGMDFIPPYLIQRGDYMRLYVVETGMDMWRLHSLRTDSGANLDIRGPMRAKHDYMLERWPQIFKYFPVTYR